MFADGFGALGANGFHLREPLFAGVHQGVDIEELLSEDVAESVADVRDAEASQEAGEAAGLTCFNVFQQLRGPFVFAFLAVLSRRGASEFQVVKRQAVNVRDRFDEVAFNYILDNFLAEAFDVHRVAAGELSKSAFELAGAFAARGRADHERAVMFAFCFRAADGAMLGKLKGWPPVLAIGIDDANHLRNDFAGFLDDDRVADADVLAGDFVGVVQRRPLHRRAGQLHWRVEIGHRRQLAGTANLHFNSREFGCRLLSLELVSPGPARELVGVAEPLPLG